MKAGRTHWTAKVSRPALERIQAAIDAASESPAEIFDRFNVAQYGISRRTFRQFVALRQRERDARAEPGSPPPSFSPAALLESLVESLQVSLDARRYPDKKLPEAIKALIALAQLDLSRQAETRAAELHAVKLAELRAKQNTALDDVSKSARLSPEQVAEIRLKVLGL